jgi:cytoskeletal protein CcmA (bactofilin family)
MNETIIGKSLIISGEIEGKEPVVVIGNVKGRMNINSAVFIEKEGLVEADVEAENIQISGSIRGNVQAKEKVEIKVGGRMQGDIKSPRILISDGATFKGKVEMDV